MLSIVSTPIGNLEDISKRAIQTLKDVDFILAENPNHSKRLLSHFDIKTPMLQFNQHTGDVKTQEYLNSMKTKHIALISDAGTPGISDPGAKLISAAIKTGIQVTHIPGATAFMTALMASGLDTRSFHFLGFLPKKIGKQQSLVSQSLATSKTIIFYESPYRIEKTLQNLRDTIEQYEICVAKELTKMHETFIRGHIDSVLSKLQSLKIKGEFVILIGRIQPDGERF